MSPVKLPKLLNKKSKKNMRQEILYEKKDLYYYKLKSRVRALRNLIKKISIDKSFKLQLVVSGTHLSKEYGFTKKIVEDKIFVSKEVKIVQKRDNPEDICKSFALATLGFSDVYKKLKPDCIIFLGDRYEILAASYSAFDT